MEILPSLVCFLLSISACFGQAVDIFTPTRLSSTGKITEDEVEAVATTSTSTVNLECGGEYEQDQGQITSPGYPSQNYPALGNCTWSIKVGEGKILMMQFEHMDMEVAPPDCPYDGVIVVDDSGLERIPFTPGSNAFGDSWKFPQPLVLGKYCGDDGFKPFKSVTNSVRVGFYSDEDIQQGGFVFSWKAVSTKTAVLHSCDFENGFSDGWQNVQSGDDAFDWELKKGNTKTKHTGPEFDHTKSNNDGYYAYIESSTPQKENDRAVLVSPVITFGEGDIEYCLEYWYHMYGEEMGSLIVATVAGNKLDRKWQKSGNHGDEWRHAMVSIKKMDGPLQIIFAGVVGKSYTGDIAIDDIKVYGKPCAEVNWKDNTPCQIEDDYPCANSTTCVTETKLCDGVADCPEMDDEDSFLCPSGRTVPPPFVETTDSPDEGQTPAEETTAGQVDDFTPSNDDYTTSDLDTTVANVWGIFQSPTTPVQLKRNSPKQTTTSPKSTASGLETTTAEEDDFTTADTLTTQEDSLQLTTADSSKQLELHTTFIVSDAPREVPELLTTTQQPDIPSTTDEQIDEHLPSTTRPYEEVLTTEEPNFSTSTAQGIYDIMTSPLNKITRNDSASDLKIQSGNMPQQFTTASKLLNIIRSTSALISTSTTTTTTASSSTTTTTISSTTTPESATRKRAESAESQHTTTGTPSNRTEVRSENVEATPQPHLTGNMEVPTGAKKQQDENGSFVTSPMSISAVVLSTVISLTAFW